jgi:2-dehydropantoate 2-reductase
VKPVVIVGAGAVGVVYGACLAASGAEVRYLVRRPPHDSALALTRIGLLGGRKTERVSLDWTTELRSLPRDASSVWVTVPATSLDERLLRSLADHFESASLVVLSPGHFVRDLVLSVVPERAVFGVIGMLSYVAPLEGSADPRERATPAGYAYLPSVTKLSATQPRRALALRDLLRRGGLETEVVADATGELTLGSAVLMPNVGCLDLVDYSFARFRAELTELAAAATQESLAVACALTGRPPPLGSELLQPWALALGTRLASGFAPLDLEGFLRVHFTKVRAQTGLLLRATLDEALRRGLPHAASTELCERFEPEAAA